MNPLMAVLVRGWRGREADVLAPPCPAVPRILAHPRTRHARTGVAAIRAPVRLDRSRRTWSNRSTFFEEGLMAAGPRERLAALISDVEKAAKQLRADVRKRAQAAPKNLETAAARLRKGAADVAGQVEKYVHDLRVNLEGQRTAPRRKAKTTRTRRARSKTTRSA
jgi:hypothetical protein